MVLGIIIDQFGSLRDHQNLNTETKQKYCFVCGIDKERLEVEYLKRGLTDGFRRHISREHSMWDYFAYLCHLQSKDSSEFTGADSQVQMLMDNEDISWVPKMRALGLDFHADGPNQYDDGNFTATGQQKQTRTLKKQNSGRLDPSASDTQTNLAGTSNTKIVDADTPILNRGGHQLKNQAKGRRGSIDMTSYAVSGEQQLLQATPDANSGSIGEPKHNHGMLMNMESRLTGQLERLVAERNDQMETHIDNRIGELMKQVGMLQTSIGTLIETPKPPTKEE